MASGSMKRARVQPVWTKRIRHTFLLMALSIIAPALAHAQEGGSSESTLWGSVLKSLGVGGENNIQYHERPPLVVPQTRDLPPPQAGGSARNPNWPTAADASSKGAQVRDLDKIPTQVGPAPTAAPSPTQSSSFFGKLFSNKGTDETAIPPTPTRKSLTQPPLDYESPSPDQPYGITPTPTPAKSATPENALATAPGQQTPGQQTPGQQTSGQ